MEKAEVDDAQSLFTSTYSIPYSDHSRLNTLDIHYRRSSTEPAASPSSGPPPPIWIVYVHGGALTDPRQDSREILPSLPHIFSRPATRSDVADAPSTTTAGVISLNYRLSPHRSIHCEPSSPERGLPWEGRNVRWPTHLNDICDALAYLHAHETQLKIDLSCWILAGYSAGATLCMKLVMQEHGPYGQNVTAGLTGLACIEGIFDYTALRDNHASMRDMYDAFTTAAFGPEEDGGWGQGNCIAPFMQRFPDVLIVRSLRLVKFGHSSEDELVESSQSERMRNALDQYRWHSASHDTEGHKSSLDTIGLMPLHGTHEDVPSEGVELARCLMSVVDGIMDWYMQSRK